MIGSLVIVLVASVLTLAVMAAVGTITLTYPFGGTVNNLDLKSEIKINSVPFVSGSPVDWGIVTSGTTATKTISIKNTGDVPFTVSYSTASLPSGCTVGLSLNGHTLQPNAEETGELSLVVPQGTPDQPITGSLTITLTG